MSDIGEAAKQARIAALRHEQRALGDEVLALGRSDPEDRDPRWLPLIEREKKIDDELTALGEIP